MTDQAEQVKLIRKLFSILINNRTQAIPSTQLNMDDDYNISGWIMEGRQADFSTQFCFGITEVKGVPDHFRALFKSAKELSDESFKVRAQKICQDIVKEIVGDAVIQNSSIKDVPSKSNVPQPIQKKIQESKKPEKPVTPIKNTSKVQPPAKIISNPKIEDKKPENIKPPPSSSIQNPQNDYNLDAYQTKMIQIPSKDLKIIVHYQGKNMDINYNYNNDFGLKRLLWTHINNALQKNGTDILTPSKQVQILNDEVFLSHAEAGNYFFDPFHRVLEIRLQRRDKGLLDTSFKSDGKLKFEDIQWKDIPELLKKTQNLVLHPKDMVEKIAVGICNKRGEARKIPEVIKALKQNGGAHQVQDLFSFEERQIKELGFQKVYAHQIFQIVQKAKGFNQQAGKSKGEKKVLSEEEKKEANDKSLCQRVGTSHKILRYLVYKTDASKLKRISLINYENMVRAIDIVGRRIINKDLWKMLKRNFFFQFASEETEKISNGMILYGPPGTGKTQITERLPELIGFHLIAEGKSAADFLTSYVGQTKRMLEGLVERARICPYIQCSLGIDEVQTLISDRKDKEQKGNTEGISILLSLIGGNRAVTNLIFLTSTNHLKKIDEAMLRRFSGQYQVGRLEPRDRQNIILSKIPKFKSTPEILDFVLNITSNFTGAALIELISALKLEQELKRHQKTNQNLTLREITDISSVICSQFKIKLGMYSLPQILSDQASRKYSFSLKFLSTIVNQILIISKKSKTNSDQFTMTYGTAFQIHNLQAQKIQWVFQKNEETIKISNYVPGIDTQSLVKWVRQIDQKIYIEKVTYTKSIGFGDYVKMISLRIRDRDQLTILIIEAPQGNSLRIFRELEFDKRVKKNLYIFYYMGHEDTKQYVQHLKWKSQEETKKLKTFTGRILIELKDNPKMQFELKMNSEDDTPFYEKTFLRTEKANVVNDVVPELIDFFTKRNLSSIFLLDYNTLMDNEAFDDKKQLDIVLEKIQEAKNYTRVALIIEVDSLINISKNLSQSSMGPSNSYSITNHNMSQFLTTIMKTFSMVEDDKERWISIVGKDKFLMDIVKQSMCWPLSEQDREKQRKDDEDNKKRRCKRCHAEFTRKENMEQKKCMQHPGYIISLKEPKFMPSIMPINVIRSIELMEKNRNEKKSSDQFVYACCAKGLGQQGEKAYAHIQEGDKDELLTEMNDRKKEWQDILDVIKKSKS